ncbi:hypothetical protein [Isoptericola haloaureus]|uniref:Uncharacterized protein n=1 Tax=Isoptericola haloaureus TaxID=1542902 RepID=A0ABU7Z769_9MICO
MRFRRIRTTAVAGALGLATLGAAPAAVAAPAVTVEAPATETSTAADVTERWTEALQELVDDGAITPARRDAVLASLAGDVDRSASTPVPHDDERLVTPQAAAQALGMTVEALDVALSEEGATLASVAADRGIGRDDLVHALGSAAARRVDAAVQAGLLGADEAAERRAALPGVVSDAVEAQYPAGPAA